jgi:hypothetical protein
MARLNAAQVERGRTAAHAESRLQALQARSSRNLVHDLTGVPLGDPAGG